MSKGLPLHDSCPSGAAARSRARVRQNRAPIALEPLPVLHQYYDALFHAHGEQRWWPARSPFEVIVGTILVQNTTWVNAAHAIANLHAAKLLTPAALQKIPLFRLARLIRCSGYFRQKARKLKAFVDFLQKEHCDSLKAMFATPTAQLREQLLQIHGIGPETADSILLYAGNHPVFVIDAYTRRILKRHGLTQGKESYEELRGLFEKSLPLDVQLFNEYHALIVHTGKHHCQARAAICSNCALRQFLPTTPEAPHESR
jgi:endonuclease-3 related protein